MSAVQPAGFVASRFAPCRRSSLSASRCPPYAARTSAGTQLEPVPVLRVGADALGDQPLHGLEVVAHRGLGELRLLGRHRKRHRLVSREACTPRVSPGPGLPSPPRAAFATRAGAAPGGAAPGPHDAPARPRPPLPAAEPAGALPAPPPALAGRLLLRPGARAPPPAPGRQLPSYIYRSPRCGRRSTSSSLQRPAPLTDAPGQAQKTGEALVPPPSNQQRLPQPNLP